MMKSIYQFYIIFWTFMVLPITVFSQNNVTVAIVKDASVAEIDLFTGKMKEEIETLFKARGQVSFLESNISYDKQKAKENIQVFGNQPKVNLIVTVGAVSSDAATESSPYTKPLIAVPMFDDDSVSSFTSIKQTVNNPNFGYIPTWLHIKKDLIDFSKMFNFQKLSIILPEFQDATSADIRSSIREMFPDKTVDFISTNNREEKFPEIPVDAEAVVLFPFIEKNLDEMKLIFTHLNSRGIPSLSIGGTSFIEEGATLTFSSADSYQKAARQVAMYVLKVSEHKNLKDLSFINDDTMRVPIINMESVRAMNKFPSWSSMGNAILLNVDNIAGEELSLQEAIAIALENNLQGKIADEDLLMAQKDVQIAQSNVLPQIEVAGTGVQLSQNLVEASMGQKGEFTITGSATLKQIIWSDAAFGNIAIKKLIAENSKYFNQQVLLDIVSEVSHSYISLLFAASNLRIKRDNVNATTKNLEMAKAKEKIGDGPVSDVNRWISELNLQKMELNDAVAKHQAIMHQLNQQLNAPINKSITAGDARNLDRVVIVNKELLSSLFENPMLTEKYTDFLISRMENFSPELQQLNTAGLVVDRKKAMQMRQMYIPEVALFGGADQAFVREGIIRNPQLPIPPPPDDIVWNVGLRLSIPISGGGRKRAETKRTLIEKDKIEWQKEELLTMLEQGIRSNVQLLRASYLDIDLSRSAAEAAADNFEVVQAGYSQGLTTVVQLIDAQNVMTKMRLISENAYYQYILDYIHIERLQGRYSFLESEEAQSNYISQLIDYLSY